MIGIWNSREYFIGQSSTLQKGPVKPLFGTRRNVKAGEEGKLTWSFLLFSTHQLNYYHPIYVFHRDFMLLRLKPLQKANRRITHILAYIGGKAMQPSDLWVS